jgi:hypothetical protein
MFNLLYINYYITYVVKFTMIGICFLFNFVV